MIVSHFEIVYKPQSPAGPADTVLQGYFLEISNLEDVDLNFALSFTTSSISDADRSLFGNAAVFVDTPGTNNNIGVFTLTGALTSKTFSLNRLVSVPAHGTALVALVPSDPFPPASVAPNKANFECRGYVTLTLPASFFRPQAKNPVRVLLSAQNRTQYSDPVTGVPKGQSQASLPIATGKAENLIVPSQPKFNIDDLIISDAVLYPKPTISPVSMLAGLLADAKDAGLDMKAFNAALKEAGIGMAIETRKLD